MRRKAITLLFIIASAIATGMFLTVAFGQSGQAELTGTDLGYKLDQIIYQLKKIENNTR